MFNFPKIERKEGFRYKNNFLKTVVFQVKFNPIDQVVNSTSELKKSLLEYFLNDKAIVKFEGSLNLEQRTPILQSAKSTTQGIEFTTTNADNVLSITEDSITLTILGTAYENFDSAIKRFESFLNKITKIIKIESTNRIAIRKINIIQVNIDSNANKSTLTQAVYNNALTHNLIDIPSHQYLDSTVITSRYADSNFYLNLIYGLLPLQSNNPNERQFLLDIDLFNESQVKLDNTMPIFNRINEEIFNIFNWSFQDEIKAVLNR